ncbi:hypothetical protein MEBOL_007823 [Melittangium boletus DSM 14713]|uniref:Uncharacterized protein n=1 Tax=Melittangium boletus DSM 14713 TaxID=1294270 RepID=A0A250ISV2_9BACT|nr:hypothetical protein MEBOL_007823 [Melittangium boletus DSM 14713]
MKRADVIRDALAVYEALVRRARDGSYLDEVFSLSMQPSCRDDRLPK